MVAGVRGSNGGQRGVERRRTVTALAVTAAAVATAALVVMLMPPHLRSVFLQQQQHC